MKSIVLVTSLILVIPNMVMAQSLEMMMGTERLFADVQWLKPFDESDSWSLFSRTRITDDYKNNTNLFSGAYLNYTTKRGYGGTLVGRTASTGSGLDVGAHFFKVNSNVLVYALASITLVNSSGLGWFSIVRYSPQINKRWKFYSSLELFSNVGFDEHRFSSQRIRLGLDKLDYQFGLAVNLTESGKDVKQTDANPGVFIRKQF